MKASGRAIDLVKKFEGFSAYPYLCPAGKRTIGYGHVIDRKYWEIANTNSPIRWPNLSRLKIRNYEI